LAIGENALLIFRYQLVHNVDRRDASRFVAGIRNVSPKQAFDAAVHTFSSELFDCG
jgi:hypothetical protein